MARARVERVTADLAVALWAKNRTYGAVIVIELRGTVEGRDVTGTRVEVWRVDRFNDPLAGHAVEIYDRVSDDYGTLAATVLERAAP